jgi:hypothetical protein
MLEQITHSYGTAFVLKEREQMLRVIFLPIHENDAAITSSGANSLAVSTKPDGPLFRSLYPS